MLIGLNSLFSPLVQNRPLLWDTAVNFTSSHRSGNNVLNARSCPRFPMYFLIHVLCLRLLLENKIVLTATQLANIIQVQAIRTSSSAMLTYVGRVEGK